MVHDIFISTFSNPFYLYAIRFMCYACFSFRYFLPHDINMFDVLLG